MFEEITNLFGNKMVVKSYLPWIKTEFNIYLPKTLLTFNYLTEFCCIS